MVAAQVIEQAVQRVVDRASFIQELLVETLEWPIPEDVEDLHELGYGWTPEDLRAQGLERHLLEGQIWQVQLRHNQPWGIFVIEFANDKVHRTVLRQVLRGLVPSRRREHKLPAWDHANLLFICATRDYERLTFAHFRGEKAQMAKLATFGWQKGDRHLRTVCEFNLPPLSWPEHDGRDADAWLKQWAKAFDKEPLTKDFFKRFDKALDAVKADLIKLQKFTPAEAYSRAQLLLERLVFLYFLQNRGWLDQKRDYLLSQFTPHRARPDEFSYYEEFLEKLFWTLASAPGPANRFQGIPFLNGGLFDDDEFAPTPVRLKNNPPLKIRNSTFWAVFDELLEAFNFTVREDTPLDQDVAVDPEMLGKVFESIVLHAEAADPDAVAPDKRKATGSYYTPRIVVHFICREVLLQYLRREPAGPDWDARIKSLFDLDAGNGLNPEDLAKLRKLLTPQEGAGLRDRLRDLKCCDPAVGSGAFPVGLLHELLALRRIVETAANGYVDPIRKHGATWLHDVKEDIVQNCLFGVDIQQQAIEICRLRLWLTLVVDYDIGLDPFNAERRQFIDAIGRISQLPNLEMNFHRGDSLLDVISDVPVRIEPGALGFRKKEVNEIQELGRQLHRAKKSEKKKELRVEILRRRLDLTAVVLQEQLRQFEDQDSEQTSWLFGEMVPDAERRRRLVDEIEKVKKAIAKLQADRTELEKLAKRPLDKDFYPKLRRLEGADFDSPLNFGWHLDFAGIFSPERGGFDVIIGNPPFVTARNPVKRKLYFERWPKVCNKNYLLVCPFFELSFSLLKPGGQLGFIVSNAFTTREFGKALVEVFFPTVDLQKLIDCSGLLFPGHGTPTCLVFGQNHEPRGDRPVRIAAILPGGGDLRTAPEDSHLWHVLARRHDEPSYRDSQVVVKDCPRSELLKWPWSFVRSDARVTDDENTDQHRLSALCAESIGAQFITGKDDVYVLPPDCVRRLRVPLPQIKTYATGEDVRNWTVRPTEVILFPYTPDLRPLTEPLPAALRTHLSAFKECLENVIISGSIKKRETKLCWFEYRRLSRAKLERPVNLIVPQVATHIHVVVSDHSILFKEKAQAIVLKEVEDDDMVSALAGVLNSSYVLYLLKRTCFNKGAGDEQHRDRYEYSGGKLEELPLPRALMNPALLAQATILRRIATLGQTCLECGRELSCLVARKLFERNGEAYDDWNILLPAYIKPHPQISEPFQNAPELLGAYDRLVHRSELLQSRMIGCQEELDWLTYAAYGLLPDHGIGVADSELCLAREERPFRLWAQAEGDFTRAVKLIPRDWSAPRRALWEARLLLIQDNEHVRRIEQPVYKRRWDEQWKIGNSWQCGQPAYDAEFLDAFYWWLSEKAEWWLEKHGKDAPLSLGEWTGALWTDPRIQAAWTVAAEAIQRLEQWKLQQNEKPNGNAPAIDASRTAFAKYFKALVKDQCVPENIPFAVPWEQVEKTVRVPAAVKTIRGKLNVPRERFRSTADGLYRVARF